MSLFPNVMPLYDNVSTLIFNFLQDIAGGLDIDVIAVLADFFGVLVVGSLESLVCVVPFVLLVFLIKLIVSGVKK